MNILVIGAHFYNKGAHLMMKTVSDKFKDVNDVNLFLSPCAGSESQIEKVGYSRLDFPLKHVTAYRSFNIFYHFGWFIRFLDKKYRGVLSPSKIDAVLDISGFAYSDQWGEKSVKNLNKVIKRFKRYNAQFIFLPQAFGPFSGKQIKVNMHNAIEMADMVAVRDMDSEKMLREINLSPKILRYPDITIGLKVSDNGIDSSEDYACIIPNERMLDQGREFWPEGKYIEYNITAIKELLAQTDYKIYVVVHDNGKGDSLVADTLIDSFPQNDRLIKYFEYDPLSLKAFLGKSKVVIGSRFHALVSALSQNVPCLSLGWSHKYKMLFEEYGIEQFAFDKPNDEGFKIYLANILDDKKRILLTEKIVNNNSILKLKNQEMWDKVLKILNI